MSDFGRKDFSTNIKQGIVSQPLIPNPLCQPANTPQMPDHSKSATRRAKENTTDVLDRTYSPPPINKQTNRLTTDCRCGRRHKPRWKQKRHAEGV